MECYSALKRKEILTHVTTWMNLENMMLHEISQTQKDKYCMSPHLRGTQTDSQRQKGERWVPGAGGEGLGFSV